MSDTSKRIFGKKIRGQNNKGKYLYLRLEKDGRPSWTSSYDEGELYTECDNDYLEFKETLMNVSQHFFNRSGDYFEEKVIHDTLEEVIVGIYERSTITISTNVVELENEKVKKILNNLSESDRQLIESQLDPTFEEELNTINTNKNVVGKKIRGLDSESDKGGFLYLALDPEGYPWWTNSFYGGYTFKEDDKYEPFTKVKLNVSRHFHFANGEYFKKEVISGTLEQITVGILESTPIVLANHNQDIKDIKTEKVLNGLSESDRKLLKSRLTS